MIEKAQYEAGGYRGFYNSQYGWICNYIENIDKLLEERKLPILKETPDRINAVFTCEKDGTVFRFHIKYDNFLRSISPAKMIRNLFKKSRALNSWEIANFMVERGIPTPKPIAFGEKRKMGLLIKAFYMTELIDNAVNIYDYFLKNKDRFDKFETFKRKAITDTSLIVGKLHRAGIVHNDLKRNNIIITSDKGNMLYLIDIESAKIKSEIPDDDRIRDILRLYRSFKNVLTDWEMMIFLRNYFRFTGIDKEKKKALLKVIKKEVIYENGKRKN